MAASQKLHEQIDRLSPRGWLVLLSFLKAEVEQGREEFAELLTLTENFVAEQGYAGSGEKENPNP